jgi:hypothetical protein
MGAWVSTSAFFESASGDQLAEIAWEFILLVRLSFGLLISVSLILTVYFGTQAWLLSNDPEPSQPFHLIRFQPP